MIKFSAQQIEKIGELARIKIDSNEVASYQEYFARVLELLDTLLSVPSEKESPLINPLDNQKA
jgi:Asp-tRNA(Asn)/Glu-tRNA(Gln) amidotransferase C subunit